MFIVVDYVKEMTMKKSCMENMDRLSICSSSVIVVAVLFLRLSFQRETSLITRKVKRKTN